MKRRSDRQPGGNMLLTTTPPDRAFISKRSIAGRLLRGTAFPAHVKDRKAVVGDPGTTSPMGVVAVIAQRAGVNAWLIVLLTGNRQYFAHAFPAPHAAPYHDRSSTRLAVAFETPACSAISLMVTRLFSLRRHESLRQNAYSTMQLRQRL